MKLITAFIITMTLPAVASATQMPTGLGPTSLRGLQARPFVVSYTGDGSGYLGGFNGHKLVRKTLNTTTSIGRLHWTAWNNTEGRAWGADWTDSPCRTCSNANDPLYPVKVNVHVYRPRNGVFTRMTFNGVGGHALTLPAFYNHGFWSW